MEKSETTTSHNLSFFPLKERPELYCEVLKLIESSFKYQSPFHFDIDFALLINEQNIKNSYLLYDEREKILIGHIGIMQRNFLLRSMKFPVAFIGGVCLNERYRGKGLFGNFLNSVLNLYTSKVSLFFLWSDQIDLYKKFAFHLGLGQVETVAKFDVYQLAKNYSYQKVNFSQLNKQDFQRIKSIYQEEMANAYLTLERDDYHWEEIKKITSTNLFIKRDERGKINSYFFSGKGLDLQNVIHEIGYRKVDKNKVISELAQGRLWLPESEIQINLQLQNFPMALVRLGNPVLFSEFIKMWSNNEVEVFFKKEVQEKDNVVTLRFKNTNYKMDFEKLILYLFGPSPAKELSSLGSSFYISGLDSI